MGEARVWAEGHARVMIEVLGCELASLLDLRVATCGTKICLGDIIGV